MACLPSFDTLKMACLPSFDTFPIVRLFYPVLLAGHNVVAGHNVEWATTIWEWVANIRRSHINVMSDKVFQLHLLRSQPRYIIQHMTAISLSALGLSLGSSEIDSCFMREQLKNCSNTMFEV